MARIKNFLTPQWLKEFEEMKLQAASSNKQKRQASSSSKRKQQASSSSSKPQAKPEPSSGSQESWCKHQAPSCKAQAPSHKLNQNLVQVLKSLDASIKPQAARLKLQATSIKLLDKLSLIKFYKVKAEGLNHNKWVVWMFHVKRDLMWRKADCVSSSDLKFYGKKVAATIIAQ